jgi:superfamily I DNA/RNA helicase/RecB family exonuclease
MNSQPVPVPVAAPVGGQLPALPDLPAAALVDHLPPGPVCVVAGPGAGKTALLEALLLRLRADGADGGLLLVPSKQAADASTERLLASPGPDPGGLGAVTWHSFARNLVVGHADRLGYRGDPRPLSGAEQWALVRSILLEADGLDWGRLASLVGTRGFADELAELLLAAQRRLLGPDELEHLAAALDRPAWAAAARFFSVYEERLALDDSIDHAGLIAQAGDLLEGHPEVRAARAAAIGTVLVDEAQELDPAQLRLLRLLGEGGARVVLAGDPAGTTDAFRGATPGALLAHAAAIGAAVVLLPGSRRLGGDGLDAARRLARLDPGALPDALAGGGPTGPGTTVETLAAPGRAEEADAVARLLRLTHERDGVPYGRMAVLLATRTLSGPVRRALDSFGVPHRLGAGEGLLVEEPVIRQVLDLFRLAIDPARADELLPGLLTSVVGGLDPHDLRALRRAAVVADRSLPELVERLRGDLVPDDLPSRVRRRAAALATLVERARARVKLEADLCFWQLWRAAPAFRRLVRQAEADPADTAVQRQLDALAAFSRALGLFVDGRPGATIGTYLDGVGRAEFASDPWLPPSAAADAVAVLGLNAAKGREFDLVAVTGCLEGVLPRLAWPEGVFEAWRLDGSTGSAERARALLDAERRRFALAASRARDRVVFTWSRAEGRGEPSRFLTELGLVVADEDDEATPAARPEATPLTRTEAAGALRRILTDPGRDRPQRLAAAVSLAAMPDARPERWWWSKDWTDDPEPIAPEAQLRTSYSRIGIYEDCHLRYFYSSVAGLDDRTSYRMEFGKLMHTIFELAAKGEVGAEPADLKAAFRERFKTAWFPSLAVAHQFWRDGLLMLRYWYEGEAELAKRALALEVGFEIEVGEHVVRGRIDRVDRADADGEPGIALLDYKTSRTVPTEAEAAGSLQLAIYYLAALRDPELSKLGPPVEMQLVYPAEQRQSRFRRVAQTPGPEHAGRVEQRLLPLLAGAAAEDFDPSPHADCRFCAFKPICPLWPQGEDFLAPTAPTEVAG